MDSKPPLKYQTWFLKVSIHCDGCRRKVKKVLQSIDGVFTTIIDQQQQKVTVTGSVTVETLLSKLLRAGKHAEIWPENISVKENKNNTHKLENDNHSYAEKTTQNCNKVMSKNSNIKPGQKSPEKSPAGNRESPQEHKGSQSGGGGGSAKKKKKKGQGDVSVDHGSAGAPAPADAGFGFQNQGLDFGREMGKMNLIPTRQKQEKALYTETGCPPPMVYAGAYYNRLYPMGGPSYYVPPYNIMCSGLDQEYGCQIQSRPLVSFEIFSDENVNGCSIM
ncbi:hypothetical protein HN51_004436 [Arachis hypogaea]|uniref:HMA domain-containing protein n=1 Tax=Arachis hypogaea TaxID=3818 RepID=A0A445DIS6_ARAHY|nr:heavy metal-associated isoprenylated plant protein 35 [Arachis hypogaea]QHO38008.1 uncharacterized protein DS421_4g116580 [Arachis hypogaea]RYR63016.1 hypothetical protein Ahy_A04g020789 [Arachis hypogaea]